MKNAIDNFQRKSTRWRALFPGTFLPVLMIGGKCSCLRAKAAHFSGHLLVPWYWLVVIDLKVRRNQPQCSNFALNIRTRQSHCGSCRSKGGRCRGTNGNSARIFSSV